MTSARPVEFPLAFYAKKASFALLDQGLFAASNFAVNILLARWLEPKNYGAFSVAFSLFLLLAALYTAVLTEPMMVLGAAKYRDGFREYLGLVIYGHLALTGVIAFILAAAACVFWELNSRVLAQALSGLAAGAPLILLSWLLRPACYVCVRPQWAAVGGALYLIMTVLAMYVLSRAQLLSPASTFGCMGVAGLVAAGWLVHLLRPRLVTSGSPEPRLVAAEHWDYGSWNIVATTLNWASGQMLLILVPAFMGLHATALVAASLNFLRPLNPVIRSVTTIALPFASRVRNRHGASVNIQRTFETTLLILPGAVLLYGLITTAFSTSLFPILYGTHEYDRCGTLVLLLSLTYTASTLIQVLSVSIKAAGDTRSIVTVWVVPSILSCVLSVPALLAQSLPAVLAVYAFSYWVGAFQCWRVYKASALTSGALLPIHSHQ